MSRTLRNSITLTAALEELNRPLVLLRLLRRVERAEIARLAGLRVGLARVQTVLSRFQLSDHLWPPILFRRALVG